MHSFGFCLAFISCWVLAEGKDIPICDGTLDRALKLALERGAFVPWKDWLYFADTSVGIRCTQLQEAISMAQMAGLIWYPNTDYRDARVLIKDDAATKMLLKNGISVDEARSWGKQ